MNEKTPRSQLTTKVKDVSNILVTVSRDSSVDQLASALSLTFALDKIGKHTTAVFSGEIPPAINFLEPEKTFEGTVDSLRDFVISLDKEKADRLRYKVEGDLVKIYITPYKTTISEKDLEFNEGDFNIELVVAIGVENKDHLDEAIAAHGKLLHDATVATMTLSQDNKSAFGSINWQDAEASSLSEMVAGLIDDLSDKDKPLLDEQIATALLTGVVAATDQFRNEKTSASVMTLAANLMAKGANQQLIASELSAAVSNPSSSSSDGSIETNEAEATPDQDGFRELTIERDVAPETDTATETDAAPAANDRLTAETEAMASESNEDALRATREQLAAIENAPAPEIAPETTPLPPMPTPDTPTSTSTPDLAPVPAPAPSGEAELDALVSNSSAHTSPYVEGSIGAPLSASVAGSDEPASVDPFAAAPPVSTPMIDAQPTFPVVPPRDALLPQPATPAPSIELPPPPPPPSPDLGQLPPLPNADPAALPSLPMTEPAVPAPAPEMLPATPASANPMFPPVDTDPNDPAQFQIPGQ